MHEVEPGSDRVTEYHPHAAERLSLKGEQLAAVKASSPVVALSAGAGSGKTTVLVERFLDSVTSDGVSPSNILAITFTEKAAAEMKERIIRRFEERGDDLNRRRAEAAYISTIHGFCARLLRENPLAAGVDPAFGIVDDMRLGFFLDEEHERMLEDDWFLNVRGLFSSGYGARQDKLFELITDCVFKPREFGRGISDEESWDVDHHVAAAMRRLDEYSMVSWRKARSALIGASDVIITAAVSGPKSTEQHRRVCEMLGTLPSLEAFDATWAGEFLDLTRFTGGVKDIGVRGAIKSVTDPVRDLFKKIVGIDRAGEEESEREDIAPLKVRIYDHASILRERYERMKSEQNLLDFEDLQRLALRLLDDPHVRSEYASRFRHILLDEAQDTNHVQKAIVNAIQRDTDQCLFAVGDLKQSIYGFRGADVSIFRDIHQSAGEGRLQLRDNYRSRTEVIEFINATGEMLWRDDELIEYSPLLCKFAYEQVEPPTTRVEMLLVEKQRADSEAGREKSDDSAIAHEREAFAIAMWIRRIVDGDDDAVPLIVYDRRARSYRRAQYGDIAILASRRTHFSIYERVLSELGIPVVADGGRGFFSGREVQDILAALRVVANPYDEIALLAALRSPLFGWSDEDLVMLRRVARQDLWAACADGFEPQGESADRDAYRTLSALRRLAQLLSPVRLMQMLLDRTGYNAALLRTARGRTGVANVQKLLEFARQSAEVDGVDLHRFIRRAELAKDYLAQEREASIAAEGEDVVLLGTIHGSKGLEWPVVILAGLDAKFDRSDSGSFYSAANGTLVIEPKGEDDKPRKLASQQLVIDAEKDRNEQEGRRLFYVGMTRAREYLILSGVYAPSESAEKTKRGFSAPIQWLRAAAGMGSEEAGDRDVMIGNATVHVSTVTEETVSQLRASVMKHDPALVDARRSVERGEPVRWQGVEPDRQARIAATVRGLLSGPVVPIAPQGMTSVTTITQLVYFARCPMVYYFNLVLQIEEHPRKRRSSEVAGDRQYSAVELGTAVHEMLERADFSAVPSEEARRLAAEGDSGSMSEHDRNRVERMLASVLSDPLIDRARTATRLEREYPFYLAMNGTLVHGVIDLVFTDADGRGVVVDYKSNDLAAPDRVNVLSRYYEPQIEMYALAATKAGLVRADEATLYFLNKPIARTFDVDIERLGGVEHRMSDALTRISVGNWETEPGEKCRNCGYRTRGFCEIGKRFKE
jgi:ATP-dependent helicase/nuclease subunit A